MAAREMGFSHVHMRFQGEEFQDSFGEIDPTSALTMTIPLVDNGRLELTHEAEQAATAAAVVSLASALREKSFIAYPLRPVTVVRRAHHVAAGS